MIHELLLSNDIGIGCACDNARIGQRTIDPLGMMHSAIGKSIAPIWVSFNERQCMAKAFALEKSIDRPNKQRRNDWRARVKKVGKIEESEKCQSDTFATRSQSMNFAETPLCSDQRQTHTQTNKRKPTICFGSSVSLGSIT